MKISKDTAGLTTSDVKPLHYAVINGALGVGKSLVGHGASVDVQAPDGTTPMAIAQQTAASSLTSQRFLEPFLQR